MLTVLAGAAAGVVTTLAVGHVQAGWVIAMVLVGFVVVIAGGLMRRMRTTYTITNQRLTIDVGLLSRNVRQTRLERIQNVGASQTPFERLLLIGTIDFDTAAESDFDFTFRGVAHPHRIVRTVDRALQGLQRSGV